MWLAVDKGVRLGAGLVVGLAVARYLGPESFGILQYAITLVAMLAPLADLGLEQIVRRRLILEPEQAGRILATVFKLRLAGGLAAASGLALYVYVGGESEGTRTLLWILCLGFGQAAGMTPDIWLQATLRARVAVMASWGALVAGAGAKLVCVWIGAGLTAFAWAGVAEAGLGCGLVWWFARRSGLPTVRDADMARTGRELLVSSWPVLLSSLMVLLYMRIDVVMLRNLSGDAAAGVYVAAVKFSELGHFIPIALATSLLPWLLRARAEGRASYEEATQRYYDLNLALAHGIVWPTFLLAGPVVALAYGSDFVGAAEVLRWHVLGGLFVFSGVARSQVLLNEGMQRFSLLTTALGAVINVALNAWWIPLHGPVGAAWATVVSYACAVWGSTWLHPALRDNAWRQTRALLIPLFAWRYLRGK